jgi:NAD(P)-dependent dehydrogenase (short-subunit alcohol dehydrogenase family)
VADVASDRPWALVTGAAGHVGRALVPRLAAAGFRVAGVDRPGSGGWPPETDRRIEVDLASPSSEAALAEAVADLTPLRLVVAAAGVTAIGTFASTDDATFRRVMDVTYHGVLRTVRATLPGLVTSRGQLVVVSSVAGFLPVLGRPAYVGAKHAVTGTCRALAAELAPDGVAVTVLHPTFLTTPVTEVGPAEEDRSHTGRPLEPADVARAVLRLVAQHRSGRRVPTRRVLGITAHLADVAGRIAPELAVRLSARRLSR